MSFGGKPNHLTTADSVQSQEQSKKQINNLANTVEPLTAIMSSSIQPAMVRNGGNNSTVPNGLMNRNSSDGHRVPIQQSSLNIGGRCGGVSLVEENNSIQTESQELHVDYEKLEAFQFERPPECPVFHPTPEEFALGPLNYINMIKSRAEPYGICKIIPPKDFRVPFSIDENKFSFKPRAQRINDLEALSRICLNFVDKLCTFWNLQGIQYRLPHLEKIYADVYKLHSIVKDEGGYEICTRDRKWGKIAQIMGFTRQSGSNLRQHYDKFLFPYDVFLSGATTHPEINTVEENVQESSSLPQKKDLNSKVEKLDDEDENDIEMEEYYSKSRFCFNCNDNHQSYALLTCKKCEKSFHKSCLIPPFGDTPKKQWHCHSCLAKILDQQPKPYTKEFGFTQSSMNYTLKKFGEMADEFKKNYFQCSSPNNIPLADLEKEFWRIVSSPYENVLIVEYGADLHTHDFGSGFPTEKNSATLPDDKKVYIGSPWNLNNLAKAKGSVFEYINANINGMVIPWMYVGMCFSAFCWHNEDHWTYSINYLHWGEPKSWYGVPGSKAEMFENAIKQLAPDLFQSQPDLLHHLVTTCNPNLLSQLDVPIYRTDQMAGQFVVTFPRSYHAGFNQGYNFAEAVNFATADWLPMGRLSIAHYSMLHRYPVFSHDELICKMSDGFKDLEDCLALATFNDLKVMIDNELHQREKVFELGIARSEYFPFEERQDDERQCIYCMATCFLSAIICACKKDEKPVPDEKLVPDETPFSGRKQIPAKMVCVNHCDYLCEKCPFDMFMFIYRYRMDELEIMEETFAKFVASKIKMNGFH